MLNGRYRTEHFVDDNAGGAEKKLSNFLNRSSIEPEKIISITHTYAYDNANERSCLSILLVYVTSVNPFDAREMGMI